MCLLCVHSYITLCFCMLIKLKWLGRGERDPVFFYILIKLKWLGRGAGLCFLHINKAEAIGEGGGAGLVFSRTGNVTFSAHSSRLLRQQNAASHHSFQSRLTEDAWTCFFATFMCFLFPTTLNWMLFLVSAGVIAPCVLPWHEILFDRDTCSGRGNEIVHIQQFASVCDAVRKITVNFF